MKNTKRVTETLLEKAKRLSLQKKTKKSFLYRNPGFEDVAIAWMKGEISGSSAIRALGEDVKLGNQYYMFSLALRDAYRTGKIIVKK